MASFSTKSRLSFNCRVKERADGAKRGDLPVQDESTFFPCECHIIQYTLYIQIPPLRKLADV